MSESNSRPESGAARAPADYSRLPDYYDVMVLPEGYIEDSERANVPPQHLDEIAALWLWLSNADRQALTRCAESMAATQAMARMDMIDAARVRRGVEQQRAAGITPVDPLA